MNMLVPQTYNPVAVANYFVQLAKAEKRASDKQLDLIKIVKLVYLAHGWSLFFYDKPLVDEAPEVWPFGPVLPSVYHTFKRYGSKRIKSPEQYFDIAKGEWITPEIQAADAAAQLLICRVWDIYKSYTGWELSDITSISHSAWFMAKKRGELAHEALQRNKHIDRSLITKEMIFWHRQFEVTVGRQIENINEFK